MAAERLTRQVGLVALGRGASTLSTMVVSTVLAWAWAHQQGQMGAYGAVWALGNTLIPLFLLGFPTTFLYFYPQLGRPGRQRLVLQAGLCLAASGLALGGLLWAAGPRLAFLLDYESGPGAGDLARYLGAFLPYAAFWVAGGLVEPALVAAGRSHWQAWTSLGVAAAQLGIGGLAAVLHWGVSEVLWAFSVLGGVRLAVGTALVWRAVGWGEGGWTGAGVGAFLRYSLPVALGDGVGSLARAVDRMVVLWFFTTETFAFYHLGAVEVPVSILLASATTVLIPQVSALYAQGRREQIAGLWSAAVARLALVVLPVFFFLFVLAGPLIGLIYPAQYGKSAWVMRVFLLALPLRCAIYNPLLVGMGKARWALWVGAGDLALNIGLSFALTRVLLTGWPAWAFLGPALATVLSTYIQVAVLVGLIAWNLRLGLRQLLPWRHLSRVGLVCAGAAVAGWAATRLPVPPLVGLGLATGVFGVVLLWGSRPADRAVFANLLRTQKNP
ncbi:MAG: oligosaccharide flippase family protein [Candidatus Latescibacteria bacterium]|nr:oligosaccharide flippase family protein [Candidatus Latescibacterota bacterium]